MGLSASKPEESFSLGGSKHKGTGCDDDRSKVTARTDDSSIFARDTQSRTSPQLSSAPIEHPQRWRSGARSAPTYNRHHAPRRIRSSDSMESHTEILPLSRRDSDPGRPQQRSIPVKCPPKRATVIDPLQEVTGDGSGAEDTEYLIRLYDTRTWEMYHRITEARKHANVSYDVEEAYAKPTEWQRREETTSEWENLQHDHVDNKESRHDMVFLFDWD